MRLTKTQHIVVEYYCKYNPQGLKELINKWKVGQCKK